MHYTWSTGPTILWIVGPVLKIETTSAGALVVYRSVWPFRTTDILLTAIRAVIYFSAGFATAARHLLLAERAVCRDHLSTLLRHHHLLIARDLKYYTKNFCQLVLLANHS